MLVEQFIRETLEMQGLSILFLIFITTIAAGCVTAPVIPSISSISRRWMVVKIFDIPAHRCDPLS